MIFLVLLLIPRATWAEFISLPESIPQEVLNETVPTAHAPLDFDSDDYTVEWVGPPLPNTNVVIKSKSIQWMRASDVLVLPRGRVELTAFGATGGTIKNAGYVQPMQPLLAGGDANVGLITLSAPLLLGMPVIPTLPGASPTSPPEPAAVGMRASFPVALLSGDRNLIHVSLKRDGKEETGVLRLKFKPRPEFTGARSNADTACSSSQVRIEGGNGAPIPPEDNDWLWIGCRLVHTYDTDYRRGNMELYVYWDGAGDLIEVNGVPTASKGESTWAFRVVPGAGEIRLKSGTRERVVKYFAADRMRLGFIGFGIGPYAYTFEGGNHNVHTVAPVLTIYSSFYFNEALRFVAFDATAIHSEPYTDLGLYLVSESVRFWDKKISLNVMLGAHTIGLRIKGIYMFKFGAPQGFELQYRDFLMRGSNAMLGTFIYPEIAGKTYYNLWLRWGPAKWFIELNYIVFREKFDDANIYNRSLGISVGSPLARFL